MIASSLTRPVSLSPKPTVARRQVGRLLGDAGWPGDIDAVLLALHEALVNAQRHGGGVSRASAALAGGTVVVAVRDPGRGFAVPTSPPVPDPAAETGRGLFLIRSLATEADVTRSGDETCLQLRFNT